MRDLRAIPRGRKDCFALSSAESLWLFFSWGMAHRRCLEAEPGSCDLRPAVASCDLTLASASGDAGHLVRHSTMGVGTAGEQPNRVRLDRFRSAEKRVDFDGHASFEFALVDTAALARSLDCHRNSPSCISRAPATIPLSHSFFVSVRSNHDTIRIWRQRSLGEPVVIAFPSFGLSPRVRTRPADKR